MSVSMSVVAWKCTVWVDAVDIVHWRVRPQRQLLGEAACSSHRFRQLA